MPALPNRGIPSNSSRRIICESIDSLRAALDELSDLTQEAEWEFDALRPSTTAIQLQSYRIIQELTATIQVVTLLSLLPSDDDLPDDIRDILRRKGRL